MSDELDDPNPFDEKGEFEDLITEGMVKKASYLIHKLAERRGADYKEIQKKCKKLFAYTNLAKVSIEEGHKIIDKLIELTGGEEESAQHSEQPPTKPTGDGISAAEVASLQAKEKEQAEQKEIVKDDLSKKPEETITQRQAAAAEGDELLGEVGKLAEMLQICVGYAGDIVKEEIGDQNVTEGTRAILVKSFSATLFIEASKRGLGR